MNLKIKKRVAERPLDEKLIQGLSEKFGFNKKLIELLNLRGISDESEIKNFLFPDVDKMYDPFLMKDMRPSVDRINQAIENGEKIVIFGDYDADGICATAILSLFLASKGVEVYSHIPNRVDEGYGLNIESLDKIIEGCMPDLIITCDCGISAHKEVEYVLDLGVDVIVTDHHEVSSIIPSCPVINPHRVDCKYPFKHLCGAGVALKLIQALSGSLCDEYLELAAIATVADLVPLKDENRLIVKIGLERLSLNRNLGIKTLLTSQKLSGSITSGDIAYKVAPMINAAGRMGDAYRAFTLLTSNDIKTVKSIVNEISEDNLKRKELCDKLYYEAIKEISKEDIVNNRCIVLSHPNWEKGITGIVAARLAGDFKRVSVILVKSGDLYKGTARSVEGVNLYDMLRSVGDILNEYGGHSQAAGFSIAEENIPAFKIRMNEYLSSFSDELFLPSLEYDLDIEALQVDKDLYKSLELIEPTGNGNAKPLLKIDAKELNYVPFRNNQSHYNVQLSGCDINIFAFNYTSNIQFLAGESQKSLIVELQTNDSFDGIKGILRGVSSKELYIDEDRVVANYLKYLYIKNKEEPVYRTYGPDELNKLIGTNIFGTLAVCGCKDTYLHVNALNDFSSVVIREQITPTVKNNYSRLIVSPDWDELMLSNYEKIIFLDSPPDLSLVSYLNGKTSAAIFIPRESNFDYFREKLDMSREAFIRYYKLMSMNTVAAGGLYGYYKSLKSIDPEVNLPQLVTCLTVFIDLGIISIDKNRFSVTINKNIKVNLTDSAIYNRLIK